MEDDNISATSDYNDYLNQQPPNAVEEGRVYDYIQYKAASSVNTGQPSSQNESQHATQDQQMNRSTPNEHQIQQDE